MFIFYILRQFTPLCNWSYFITFPPTPSSPPGCEEPFQSFSMKLLCFFHPSHCLWCSACSAFGFRQAGQNCSEYLVRVFRVFNVLGLVTAFPCSSAFFLLSIAANWEVFHLFTHTHPLPSPPPPAKRTELSWFPESIVLDYSLQCIKNCIFQQWTVFSHSHTLSRT